MPNELMEALPNRIEAVLSQLLGPNETVHVKLRGAFKEALVCTDFRVLILKSGYMTGQVFGSDTFQQPYANIAGVQVKFHLMNGYFEVNTGGMQNTAKSYWAKDKRTNSSQAPNCVSFISKSEGAKFQQACSFILGKINDSARGDRFTRQPERSDQSPVLIADELAKLASLRDEGILTEGEFAEQKARWLGQVSS